MGSAVSAYLCGIYTHAIWTRSRRLRVSLRSLRQLHAHYWEKIMTIRARRQWIRVGKVKYALLGLLLGLPLPIILILLFVRGCDF
jgi:hypothetical protein